MIFKMRWTIDGAGSDKKTAKNIRGV